MPAKKKTRKVARKKATAKKKVARKATKKPAASRKKAAKKKVARKATKKPAASRKKAAKKKVVKKKASRKRIAKKKATAKKKTAKKSPAKKKASRKRIAKKKATAKKKVAKKTAKTTTGKPKKKTMGKVTNIKKSPTLKSPKTKLLAKKKIAPYKKIRKNEDYMGSAQTEHFREILLVWKTELMQEVDRTVNHMQDDATNFPDPNDRASQEEEFALELRTRDRERKLISKIDESITMLDSGDYGFCEICGIEIGIRRLEARPTATQCIDCKTLDEIKERHLG